MQPYHRCSNGFTLIGQGHPPHSCWTAAVLGSGDRPLNYRFTTAPHPQSHRAAIAPPYQAKAMRSPRSSQPKAHELKQRQRRAWAISGEQAEALAVVRRMTADRPSPSRALVCLAFASFRNAIALSTASALAKRTRGCRSQ
jgi:hypothetical protein